jgi:signal transduction histidine kinase/CheY-like chemotaxis protein
MQHHSLTATHVSMSRPPDTATVPPVAPEDGLDRRVLDAQTLMLYRRSRSTVITGIVFSLLVCIGLSPYVHPELVWGWFALRCCMSVFRLVQRHQFYRSEHRGHDSWRHWFVVGAALDGFLWGPAGTWLIPQNHPEVHSLILVALVGVSSVAVFVLQPSWRASAAFLLTLLVPVAVFQFSAGTRFGLFAGLGLLMFLGLLLVEAKQADSRIRELLRLRFNTDRIAEERAQALLLAQRQSSVKSQFLATMSHEMRTPLHGILGLTRMLQRDAAPETGQQLLLIGRAGEHLLTLINDVLDFSKLEAGQVKLAPQVFDLAALVDDAVSLSMPSACEVGLTLTARMHMPRPCLVSGDPSRLRQVLHNLVGNAIKFTGTGSVTVVAKHRFGRARIAVHDTGTGIAPEDVSRIFDAFHQADSSFTRRYAGTGLGLTIARELARAMGGDLVCTSKLGRGSCFTVTLDLPSVTEAPAVAATPDPQEAAGAPALSGRILLAEDNPVNAIVAEASLRRIGFEVELVTDGAQALASFKARVPNLVLLDCQMPVMDGFEAARRMRDHEREHGLPRTPVLALTANALEGDREQSLAAGMDEHLAKPFREEELRAVLLRLLTP